MEPLAIIIYIVYGVLFSFAFFFSLSTSQAKRRHYSFGYLAALCVCLILLILTFPGFNILTGKLARVLTTQLIGFAFSWPVLLAQLIVRQRIEAPVVFLKRGALLFIGTILGLAVLTFMIVIGIIPHVYTVPGHRLVYGAYDVLSNASLLFSYIPLEILCLNWVIERTAFCRNGLYLAGALFDWSNFRKYTWTPDYTTIGPGFDEGVTLELLLEPKKKIFFFKPIRLYIPSADRPAVDAILTQNINHPLESAGLTS